VQALAAGFGCPARRVASYDELGPALDDALVDRSEPLVLECVVEQDPDFAP